jgi:hypothetical protein
VWAEITAAPQDGDTASTNTGAAPLVPNVVEVLADRDAYLLDALEDHVATRRVFYTDGAGVLVEPLRRLTLGGVVYNSTALLTLGGFSGMTPFQLQYFYVHGVAGVLALERSTTAPAFIGGYAYKTGDATRRYVGCAPARTATHLFPLRMVNGRATFHRGTDGLTQADFNVLAGTGHDTGYTSVDLTKWVPPHAVTIRLQVEFEARTTNVDSVFIQNSGDANAHFTFGAQAVAAGDKRVCPVDVINTGTPGCFYKVSHASDDAQLYADGWDEG